MTARAKARATRDLKRSRGWWARTPLTCGPTALTACHTVTCLASSYLTGSPSPTCRPHSHRSNVRLVGESELASDFCLGLACLVLGMCHSDLYDTQNVT